MTRIAYILLIFLLCAGAQASLAPNDVVVVWNGHPYWNTGDRQSKAVADYYCAERGIPTTNEIDVSYHVPGQEDESMAPDQFLALIATPIANKLSQLAGLPIGTAPNLASDPTKCIVLCYGIPILVSGDGVTCGVDSSLALLFNKTPWGHIPLAGYPSRDIVRFANPYYEAQADPADRTKAADFTNFRSSSDNKTTETAPKFTIVRLLDSTHAIAAGQRGLLYRGTLSDGVWNWTPVEDVDKVFNTQDVTDICVLDSQHYWLATAQGAVIRWDSGTGAFRSTSTRPHVAFAGCSTPTRISVSCDTGGNCWTAGSYVVDTSSPYQLGYCIRRNGVDLIPPEGFQPHSIAAVSGSEAWVSGNLGIYRTTNSGATWTQVYPEAAGDIWVRGNVGWAVALQGYVLYYDGTSWTRDENAPSLDGGAADLAVYDANHLTIACGTSAFYTFDGSAATPWQTNTSASAKASVAWNGGSNVVAAESASSMIRTGTGSPGLFSWQDDEHSLTLSSYDWRLRYLVCRLDARSLPLDGTEQIPADIKAMIDGSKASDSEGAATALLSGKHIFDDAPPSPASLNRRFSDEFKSALDRLVGCHGGLVHREPGDGSIGSPPNSYLCDQTNVATYASSGYYDYSSANVTTFWRPRNEFLDGSIGFYRAVSGSAFYRGIRRNGYFWDVRRDNANAVQGKLRVYMERNELIYHNCWIDLRQADGTSVPISGNPDSRFQNEVQLHPVFRPSEIWNVWVAEIPLSAVNWPGGDNNAVYVAIHFPNDDPEQPGGIADRWPDSGVTTEIYQAWIQNTGITYGFGGCTTQSVVSELIHEGACGSLGCIIEPAAGGATESSEISIPQYLTGRQSPFSCRRLPMRAIW